MTDPKNRSLGDGVSRRGVLRGVGAGALGAGFGALSGAGAQTVPETLAWAETGVPPYRGVRILEKSGTLAGRLAGLLFADQGAEVYVERSEPSERFDDTYFDRGKTQLPARGLEDTASADVIIVDGEVAVDRAAHQIVLRITAALPGDEAYGYLPHDCSDDLLNAITAFYTDMSITGPMLGRPVIYTPLPLASVYAGVNGAVGTGAALVDRTRTGLGREVTASRIAGGLSAIGALSLTVGGLPDFLTPIQVGGLPPGLSPAEFGEIVAKASSEPRWQLWLEQRFAPLAAPYRTLDGGFILPLAGANRRLTRQCLEVLGLYDEALTLGMVDESAFVNADVANARNNLADSLALRFDLTSALADRLEPIFASRTAEEWQVFLDAHGIPNTKVLSWQEWLRDPHARQSAIIAAVRGTDDIQIGRSSWVESAQPYADLEVPRRAEALPPRTTPVPAPTGRPVSQRPLEGFSVVDFANVVAAPSCGRMLAELGCNVVKVLQPDPFHSPTIVAAWSAEMSAGKRTVILDAKTPEGQGVALSLISKADFVLANILDHQLARLRIDPVTLSRISPSAILVQVTALRGERRGPRNDEKGYDPSQQATTGVTMRFGGAESPTYHGVASCVDYLCGYLGAWAAVSALYKREVGGEGRGDWCATSLATAATLTQLLLQKGEPPASAVGQYATGMTEGARVYQLSDGWIFAEAAADISADLAGLTRDEALATLAERGVLATPVQSARAIADRHRDAPSRTVVFERTEKDGWWSECFAPTWIVYDDAPFPRSSPVSRVGADAPAILAELGYASAEIRRLVEKGIVGRSEWATG